MSRAKSTEQLFSLALKQGALLILAVAIIGGAAGWFAAGMPGLLGALIGAGLTLVFVSVTILSIKIGGRLGLGGFFGAVMGAWLVKIVVFLIVMASLKDAEWLDGPTLFFTLVAAVLGTLALDAFSIAKARIPSFEQ